ncbi:MAG: response regulator [Chloroflexota bacterium]
MVDMVQDGLRVLVIDDEASIRRLVSLVLAEEGYAPISAASGAEGLELAAADAPALVLLDVMMPDLDGVETLRRLRLLPGLDAVPVIMMTAAVSLARDIAGAQDVLSKPFDIARLLLTVETAVSTAPRPA